PDPAQNACAPWLQLPASTTSPPRHDAPPEAWQSLGTAVPGSGAVHPRPAPSGTRRVYNNNSTIHATRGKAVGDRRAVDNAAERRCTFLPLRLRHSLAW